MKTKISEIESYLPKNIISNDYLEKTFDSFSAKKIEKKIGIRNRHIAEVDETSLDMAEKVSKKLLADYDKSKVDFLLLCTQSPDYFLPTSACILQDRLGLNRSIGSLDFNLGCSGYIYGLAMAKGLISAYIAKSVLLVTSETYSKFLKDDDVANRSIFGDGAAATIIEKSEEENIFEFELGTDGSGFENLIVKNGAMRNRKLQKTNDDFLYMSGPEIFNFTIENIPLVISNTLAKNNLTMEEIDYVIFHQANKYMLNYLRKKIKIPKEKFYINMTETGNTVSSTIPIALKDSIDKKVVKKGDKVLLVGFGVGYSWGGVVIEI